MTTLELAHEIMRRAETFNPLRMKWKGVTEWEVELAKALLEAEAALEKKK